MKKFLLFFLLLLPIGLSADVNRWTIYSAYHNANRNITTGSVVYSLCEGALLSYSPGDTEVRIYNKATGLSDCDIQYMVYGKNLNQLLLVYQNQNMDVLDKDGNIYNLPQYKNSAVNDKTINDVTIEGKKAYLATNTGVVVINLERKEFVNTYTLGKKTHSCIATEKFIYAATVEGVYRGDVTKNLLDIKNWERLNGHVFEHLVVFNQSIYASSSAQGLYQLKGTNAVPELLLSDVFRYIQTDGSRLFVGNATKTYLYSAGTAQPVIVEQANDFESLSYANGLYWASCGMKGLQAYKLSGDTFKAEGSPITPNSPIRNYGAYLKMTSYDRLLIAGGGHNYTGIDYPGTLMQMQQHTWTNFSEDNIIQTTHVPYMNMTSIVEDPKDATHHFASAAGTGIYEFRNAKMVAHYDCDNSPLQSILPSDVNKRQYVRINGLTYDPSENIWMLNNEVDTVVRIKMKNGGWTKIYIPELEKNPTMDKIMFDSRGWAWITSRRTTQSGTKAGILCLNYNGTLGTTSDDKTIFHSTFTNQDNVSYSFNLVFDIVEDMDHQLWIATDKGPFVITQVDNLFNRNFIFNQIKIPRNDGTNYADYLLNGTTITAIAVDGANRKWIGTELNGIYLVSSDGQKTIHHFTAEDSPLLSNSIYSIAVSHTSGEVVFGTDKGICSYRSDATDAAETLNENEVKVYPNPIRPEYRGNISISGLTLHCDVKITSTAGQLVAAGTSEGGTFIWDGCNKNGKRVASGVYYVLAATSDGGEGVVARVVVIK
ncbi:MAG: hypothetical protein RR386_05440 [Bacteroidaceae bacterium]